MPHPTPSPSPCVTCTQDFFILYLRQYQETFDLIVEAIMILYLRPWPIYIYIYRMIHIYYIRIMWITHIWTSNEVSICHQLWWASKCQRNKIRWAHKSSNFQKNMEFQYVEKHLIIITLYIFIYNIFHNIVQLSTLPENYGPLIWVPGAHGVGGFDRGGASQTGPTNSALVFWFLRPLES